MLKKTSQAGLGGMINLRRFAIAAHLEANRIKNRSAKSTDCEDGLSKNFSLSIGESSLRKFSQISRVKTCQIPKENIFDLDALPNRATIDSFAENLFGKIGRRPANFDDFVL
jgi:hypothetical protein